MLFRSDYESGDDVDMSIIMKNRNGDEEAVDVREFFQRKNSYGLNAINSIDLLKLGILLEKTKDESFIRDVGQAIERDIYDIYTEHGGFVTLDNNLNVVFTNYDPIETERQLLAGNNEYNLEVLSFNYPALNTSISPTIAVYHFHATDLDDTEAASPSYGDLKETRDNGVDGIVITKLIGNRFNIDFFTSKGVVIDLGDYLYDLNHQIKN